MYECIRLISVIIPITWCYLAICKPRDMKVWTPQSHILYAVGRGVVLSTLKNRLLSLLQSTACSTLSLYADFLLLLMRHTSAYMVMWFLAVTCQQQWTEHAVLGSTIVKAADAGGGDANPNWGLPVTKNFRI